MEEFALIGLVVVLLVEMPGLVWETACTASCQLLGLVWEEPVLVEGRAVVDLIVEAELVELAEAVLLLLPMPLLLPLIGAAAILLPLTMRAAVPLLLLMRAAPLLTLLLSLVVLIGGVLVVLLALLVRELVEVVVVLISVVVYVVVVVVEVVVVVVVGTYGMQMSLRKAGFFQAQPVPLRRCTRSLLPDSVVLLTETLLTKVLLLTVLLIVVPLTLEEFLPPETLKAYPLGHNWPSRPGQGLNCLEHWSCSAVGEGTKPGSHFTSAG